MTDQTVPTTVDLSKYIETRFFGERPHLRGRRIWVSMIAGSAEHNKWDVPTLAHEFTISEEEVLAALLYYKEHKEEIDRQDAEEEKLWDEMYEKYGEKHNE